MTTQEELDAWIANMMEPKPESQPLYRLRMADDALYNCAERSSPLGWWVCECGMDGEIAGVGASTMCKWRPKYEFEHDDMESKAAAMQVLERCAEKCSGMDIEIRRRTIGETGWLITWSGDYHNASEETLPLTICKFARELFKEETK